MGEFTRVQKIVLAGLIGLALYALWDAGWYSPDRFRQYYADPDNRMSVQVLVMLIPSIILHEISHGWAALGFGDDTAKRAGRLTLNPIPHIDPWGSVMLPVIMMAIAGGAFGYAKPVPVNPARMRSPRNHNVLTALVGPGTNIALVALSLLLLHVLPPFGDGGWLVALGYANVLLAAFNLIPIPPLDGSAVIERFLPVSWWPKYLQLRQYSFGILLLAVFVLPLHVVFEPAFRLFRSLLPGCGRLIDWSPYLLQWCG